MKFWTCGIFICKNLTSIFAKPPSQRKKQPVVHNTWDLDVEFQAGIVGYELSFTSFATWVTKGKPRAATSRKQNPCLSSPNKTTDQPWLNRITCPQFPLTSLWSICFKPQPVCHNHPSVDCILKWYPHCVLCLTPRAKQKGWQAAANWPFCRKSELVCLLHVWISGCVWGPEA